MANLKNITDLPVAESAEGLNLIVNDNGAAKQIPSSAVGAQADWAETDENSPAFVKNKPSKELVYEWNFSAEDEVCDVAQNVNDDLSWMIDKNNNIGFEVEAIFYGSEEHEVTDDTGETYYEARINTNIEAMITITDSQYYLVRLKSDKDHMLYGYNESGGWMPSHSTAGSPYFDFYILDRKHIDDDWNYIEVSNGGSFEMYANGNWLFKSIKIYKITR